MNALGGILAVAIAASACAPAVANGGATLAPGGETVMVTRVIDGDTFVVADGRHVRVLGIDSCEHGTTGGDAATAAARALLPAGTQVTLDVQRGVDVDRYQRPLRYVHLDGGPDAGQDYGTVMVAGTHTGVYAGHNDASPEYLARLRAADQNGRTC